MNRTCDGCSECCKGWLRCKVLGHDVYPGKPCFYLQKGCTIYDSPARPKNPCQEYKCHWLETDDLPMWMRPDLSNALVTQRNDNGHSWLEVLECGSKMDSEVLSWLVIWALNQGKNLKYQINGGWSKIGSKEFLEAQV